MENYKYCSTFYNIQINCVSLRNFPYAGNSNLFHLTSNGYTHLRIELMDHNCQWRYAEYRLFYIQGETNNFRMHVSSYSGNAGFFSIFFAQITLINITLLAIEFIIKDYCLFVCLFDCSFSSNLRMIFLLIWRRHHYRWRAANFDLCSALMAIVWVLYRATPTVTRGIRL